MRTTVTGCLWVIMLLLLSCKEQFCNRNFFGEMQEDYAFESLSSELVESQLSGFGLACHGSRINNKLYYSISSDDDSEWILNGYIRLEGEKVMFLENENAREQLFLNFGAVKERSWDVGLNNGSKASLTYRGKFYDNILKDSLDTFKVEQSIKRKFEIPHAPQLGWIVANKDAGIVMLSYTTQLNEVYTVRLTPQLELKKFKN